MFDFFASIVSPQAVCCQSAFVLLSLIATPRNAPLFEEVCQWVLCIVTGAGVKKLALVLVWFSNWQSFYSVFESVFGIVSVCSHQFQIEMQSYKIFLIAILPPPGLLMAQSNSIPHFTFVSLLIWIYIWISFCPIFFVEKCHQVAPFRAVISSHNLENLFWFALLATEKWAGCKNPQPQNKN